MTNSERSVNTRSAQVAFPTKPLLLAAVCAVAASLAFGEAMQELVNRWMRQEEYSHGFLIPAISAWLIWSRRAAIAESVGRPSWSGLGLIAIAGILHVIGKLSALFVLSQVAFVICLMGIALCFGGFSLLRILFIPIVFLLFAIPMPYFVDSMLSFRLQLISSSLGVWFIRLFQVPVYLEGNVIDLGNYRLQVVEACSGLRYLYPLLSLGFLAAYLFSAPFWQRAIVFLSTIPITIVMNSLRIAVVGLLVDRFGPQDADGFLHLFEGWIIFIACAALLMGQILLFARLRNRRFFDVFAPPLIQPTGTAPRAFQRSMPAAASLVAILVIGAAGYALSAREEIKPNRLSFAGFPMQLGDWRGRPSVMDPNTEKYLGLTDYILSDYRDADGKWVNFYVAYYASQRNGLSPHSPSVCIPGGGWQIAELQRTASKFESGVMPLNRVVISKGSDKQIVYYWFEQRGRKIANEWISKGYLLWDAVFRNRTDGALVRLTTSVFPGETEDAADRRLKAFATQVLPTLAGYLPPETLPAPQSATSGTMRSSANKQ